MQEYIQACPHHGMQDWLLIQSFYHGLFIESYHHLDAAAGGAFFSLNVKQAKELSEKMLKNQGWTDNHLQGTNNIQLVNSISLDSLLNRLDERANWKRDRATIEHYSKLRATTPYGHCHDAEYCRKRDVKSLLNDGGYGPPPPAKYLKWNMHDNKGNSPSYLHVNSSLEYLVFNQARINEKLHTMLLQHDKMLGKIHVELDNFTMSLKEELSFNKRLGNQVANFKSQVAYHEKVNAVTTRGGKATSDPPHPKPVSKKKSIEVVEVEEEALATPKTKVRTNPHEFL